MKYKVKPFECYIVQKEGYALARQAFGPDEVIELSTLEGNPQAHKLIALTEEELKQEAEKPVEKKQEPKSENVDDFFDDAPANTEEVKRKAMERLRAQKV
jgi:hypothetical protein